jgi:hypothetical protein
MTATATQFQYLSSGNIKTGDAASFDLPAKTTCPGMTTGPDGCADKCYAFNMSRAWKNVAAKYNRNYNFSKTSNFVVDMADAIPHRGAFRIHVSGDFYSPEYVEKWIEIATRRKNVMFYCYTRSWRIRNIWRKLRQFAALPNVTVNISCDRVTGKPFDSCKSFKWCYLSMDDTAPRWLRQTDLIFRDRGRYDKRKRKNAEKRGVDPNSVAHLVHRINSVPVCPLERGADLRLKCSECKICLTNTGLEVH